MSSAELVELFEAYRSDGYASVRTVDAESSLAWFYRAVLAYAEGEFRDASAFAATAAAREPENIVFDEAARWLERRTATGRAGVYELRDAFAAFVRGGGNVALYAATSERLRRVYGSTTPLPFSISASAMEQRCCRLSLIGWATLTSSSLRSRS